MYHTSQKQAKSVTDLQFLCKEAQFPLDNSNARYYIIKKLSPLLHQETYRDIYRLPGRPHRMRSG